MPSAVREVIGRAQGRLRRLSPPGAVRWSQPAQFHVTLVFLGDVPAAQVAGLEESLAPVVAASTSLWLRAHGLGFFPNSRQPRVIWAGARDRLGQLSDLHERLTQALRWLAPAAPAEKFTGHITLGRFKPGHHAAIPRLLELAGAMGDMPFGEWRAETVELVRSELTSTGAEHTVLLQFPLAG